MTCYHPIPAYQDTPGEELRLWPPVGTANLELPCGSCIGCKTSRATDWARRAEHEASSWEHNCFLTLTYDDKHLPRGGDLEPAELQKFIKRLRTTRHNLHPAVRGNRAHGVRYLACGEYGERTGRPHYHLLLFNCDFNDTHAIGSQERRSDLLQQLWPYGNHCLGTVTGASANYVAQYTLKKQGTSYCDQDGVVKPPPFLRMSLKPAIGTRWLEKNKRDLTHGYLVTNGTKGRIPRTYKNKLRVLDPQRAEFSEWQASKQPHPRENLAAAEIIHRRRAELGNKRSL